VFLECKSGASALAKLWMTCIIICPTMYYVDSCLLKK
jgi:hypothetical protein